MIHKVYRMAHTCYNSLQYKAGFYTIRIFGRILIYLAFCVINL